MIAQAGNVGIALVTGASRGFGASVSLLLAEKGYTIITVARTVGGLEELDDRIRERGCNSFLCVLDITNDSEVQAVCQNIYSKFGHIDLWIHTAINSAPLNLTHQTEQKILKRSVAVNILATSHLINCIHPLLKKAGQAVFLDDPRLSKKFMGIYGSTKRAQIELARAWSLETANLGPKVIIYTPSEMYTKTTLAFFPGIRETDISTSDDEARKLIDTILT
ncbi:MAG: SDR family NAD(P)-dependent oxidoreductase [Rhodobacteraceae bacterium]|nr:SDR family NAD(P)-dependent oxidoreductase [Paracoccaceae bacterium]